MPSFRSLPKSFRGSQGTNVSVCARLAPRRSLHTVCSLAIVDRAMERNDPTQVDAKSRRKLLVSSRPHTVLDSEWHLVSNLKYVTACKFNGSGVLENPLRNNRLSIAWYPSPEKFDKRMQALPSRRVGTHLLSFLHRLQLVYLCLTCLIV
jgi:hypothetical protein